MMKYVTVQQKSQENYVQTGSLKHWFTRVLLAVFALRFY